MIDIKVSDGIAIMTMGHGKANALDIEFCDAMAARFIDSLWRVIHECVGS